MQSSCHTDGGGWLIPDPRFARPVLVCSPAVLVETGL